MISSIKPINFEVQTGLREICARHHIEEYDALEAMKAAFQANGGATGARSKPLYYEIDRHLTAEGNRVMFDYLAPLLEPMLPRAR